MSQERKSTIEPVVKNILKKYKMKGSLSVDHSTLVLTVKSGPIDFKAAYNVKKRYEHDDNSFHYQINPYWYHEHFDGVALNFLKEIIDAMNVGNHDNSDIMTDYFDVGWYINVNIGKWDKLYEIVI